jgi:hypothetical protein
MPAQVGAGEGTEHANPEALGAGGLEPRLDEPLAQVPSPERRRYFGVDEHERSRAAIVDEKRGLTVLPELEPVPRRVVHDGRPVEARRGRTHDAGSVSIRRSASRLSRSR